MNNLQIQLLDELRTPTADHKRRNPNSFHDSTSEVYDRALQAIQGMGRDTKPITEGYAQALVDKSNNLLDFLDSYTLLRRHQNTLIERKPFKPYFPFHLLDHPRQYGARGYGEVLFSFSYCPDPTSPENIKQLDLTAELSGLTYEIDPPDVPDFYFPNRCHVICWSKPESRWREAFIDVAEPEQLKRAR